MQTILERKKHKGKKKFSIQILKTLVWTTLNVVIVNAQDINLSVRVVKYKDENDNVVTLADSEGTSMAVRFLNADTEEDNNVEVSWVINIINPYWQISRAWARPICEKLIKSLI